MAESWLHEAVCRQKQTAGESCLHEAVCRQRPELWLTVGYMDLCAHKELNCG